MALAKRVAGRGQVRDAAASKVVSRALFAPIDDILASGGDRRLTLCRPSFLNMYGCTPYPRPEQIDFASSTASSISEEAYARVLNARDEYLAKMISEGARRAFKDSIGETRRALLKLLTLQDAAAKVVFAASGTDAQIQALFLTKSCFGTPLTTIIVGADQTGSGTAYTSRGQHFSDATACGHDVEKGGPVGGLADGIRNINIPFRQVGDRFQTLAEMDKSVISAVEAAIADGSKVLLQTMDASKFGWRAPSDDCVEQIVRRWPGGVQVVVDACQMRIPRSRLGDLLAKDFMVLITGSKFFTGPAFSGALLVPPRLSAAVADIEQVPTGLSAYTTAYDWPEEWTALSSHFPSQVNFGQWLRWEAALEEMRLYYAIPRGFRDDVQARLADHVERLVEASPHLKRLSFCVEPDAMTKSATMFPVLPHKNGVPLSPRQCALLYQALRRDLSDIAGEDAEDAGTHVTRAFCQVGQPVLLSEQEGAALRISISARTIRQCWSPERHAANAKRDRMLGDLTTLVKKLNFAIRNIESIEKASP